MVMAIDVNRDIRFISRKVGTAVFAYEDIFNPEIDNEFHYDYNRVIKGYSQVKKISIKEAEEKLIEQGVLRPLPNGEYKVNVGGSTEKGGGLNYHGEVFFSFDQKDYITKYHELAHSLQSEYDLFNEDKIKAKYDIAERRLTEEQKQDLLIDKGNYHHYLKEMHSESFAYAAMMLRSSNTFDFIRQMSSAYNAGSSSNFAAVSSFGKTEYGANSSNDAKFYATKPVMKATIKAIKKIRKEKKVGEFFDEKGVIRDEKLAKLCENIVMESAYSPRTLNSFFNYKVLDSHNSEEHGWRLDAIKSVVHSPVASVMTLVHEGNIVDKIKKIAILKKLKRDNERKLNKYLKKSNKCDNPEMEALKEYERLQLKLLQMDEKFPNEYLSFTLSDKLPNMSNHVANDAVLRNIANSCSQKSDVYKDLVEFNNIIALNHSNPYFKQLLQAQPNTSTLRTMMKELNENPNKKVFEEYNLQPKKINHGLITYVLKNNMNKIEDFTQKHQLNSEIQEALLNIMINNPELLKHNSTRKKLCEEHQIKGDSLGIQKRKFDKEFNQLADTLYSTFYNLQDSPKYQQYIAELKKIPIDDNFVKSNMEKITILENEERAEHKAHSDLRKEVYNGLDNMEENLELKGKDYYKASMETVKALASLDKDERTEILESQLPEIKETLEPLIEKLPPKALSKEEIAELKIEITTEINNEASSLQDKDNLTEKQFDTDVPDKRKAIEEKLTSWGIDKDSYMIIVPEDNVYTSYNGVESRSMQTCFDECKKDLQNAGTDIVYGTNNGVTAAYFAEDVYVVSKNSELRKILYYKGQDTNIGVVMSNGEEFRTSTNEPDIARNQEYASVKDWKPKETHIKDETTLSQNTSTPVIKVADTEKNKLEALSGRVRQVSTTVTKEENPVIAPQVIEQNPIQQTQEPIKVESTTPRLYEQKATLESVTTSSRTTVSEMSDKEKLSFFKNLRKGVNTLLSKVSLGKEKNNENQTTQQIETNTQAQMLSRASDRGR